eukprot:g25853.t1
MGEPNEIAEGVGAINLAGGGFWKTWGEVEEKAPTEMKNPRLVRKFLCREVSLIGKIFVVGQICRGSDSDEDDQEQQKAPRKCFYALLLTLNASMEIQTLQRKCSVLDSQTSPDADTRGPASDDMTPLFWITLHRAAEGASACLPGDKHRKPRYILRRAVASKMKQSRPFSVCCAKYRRPTCSHQRSCRPGVTTMELVNGVLNLKNSLREWICDAF